MPIVTNSSEEGYPLPSLSLKERHMNKVNNLNILLVNTIFILLAILSLFGGFSGTVELKHYNPWLSLQFAFYISIVALLIQLPTILIMVFKKMMGSNMKKLFSVRQVASLKKSYLINRQRLFKAHLGIVGAIVIFPIVDCSNFNK